MPINVSFRDVNFHASTDGVRVIVTTDIPCHVYSRYSAQEPRIHKKPSYRRGLWLSDDVRFCFTVFEDHEQTEAGDTLIHTFWETTWPYCTTRWCYFFASVAGLWSVSTSPYFKWHNDDIDPVYPEDVLYTFNSIEPELDGCGSGNHWNAVDLQHDVPPDATGIIFNVFTSPIAGDRKIGFRPRFTSIPAEGRLRGGCQEWGIVGLYENRWIETFGCLEGGVSFWVMGYTGRNVHFLKPVVDVTPPLALVWQDVDLSPYIPAGAIPIFDLTHNGYAFKRYAVRPKGGTFRVWGYTAHNWIIISPDVNGIVQFYCETVGFANIQIFLTGYIVGGSVFHIDSINRTPAGLASWENVPISNTPDVTKWAALEIGAGRTDVDHGVRKCGSLRDHKRECGLHSWVYVHTNPTPMVQIWRPSADFEYWEHGVTN